MFSFFTFIKFNIEGKENINKHCSYVFVVNHTSFLDAIAIALAVPVQFRTLAKKELVKIPLLGLILKKASIIVDRSSPQSRQDSISRMKLMLKQGISILIFPEGTQNRSGQPLTKFHTGAFRIAKDTDTAIIPVVIKGAGILMPPSKLVIKPGKIEIQIKEEVSASVLNDLSAEELSEQVFKLMWSELTDGKKERVV